MRPLRRDSDGERRGVGCLGGVFPDETCGSGVETGQRRPASAEPRPHTPASVWVALLKRVRELEGLLGERNTK
jgi:hypothetical protein